MPVLPLFVAEDDCLFPGRYYFVEKEEIPLPFWENIAKSEKKELLLMSKNSDSQYGVLANMGVLEEDVALLATDRVRILNRTSDTAEYSPAPFLLTPSLEEKYLVGREIYKAWLSGVSLERFDEESRQGLEECNNAEEWIEILAADLPWRKNYKLLEFETYEMVLSQALEWIKADLANDPIRGLIIRLAEIKFSPSARAKIDFELKNYHRNPDGIDAGVIIAWLSVVADLPWNDSTSLELPSLLEAEEAMGKEHYGMQNVKDVALDQLASTIWWNASPLLSRAPNSPALKHILLSGAPGVGKSSIIGSIAKSQGRLLEMIPCGGISDPATLFGFERTYVGSRMGAIMDAVRKHRTVSLVLGFDEIDKMTPGHNGDPYAVVMALADPLLSESFMDRHLQMGFDLSRVMVVATANQTINIPSSLLDRLQVIEVRGYTLVEKLEIIKNHVFPKLLYLQSLTDFSLSDDVIVEIIEKYTFESGIRTLSRLMLSLIQREIRFRLSKAEHSSVVTLDRLEEYLGDAQKDDLPPPLLGEPGYGNYLFSIPESGHGGVGSLEMITMRGKGVIKITGSVGKMIEEVTSVAVGWAQRHRKDLRLEELDLINRDYHLHLEPIAVKKDGPSTGVPTALALLSALRNTPLPQGILSTGEIGLDGRILPVGSIPEKIIAAHRVGGVKVFIPQENKKDLLSIPQDVLDSLEIIPVATLAEILSNIDWG